MGGLPNLLQYYIEGGLPNLLQYYIGEEGSQETPKSYYIIYGRPLPSLFRKILFSMTEVSDISLNLAPSGCAILKRATKNHLTV